MKLGPGFESCPSGVVRPFPTDFWPQCSPPGKWGLALAPGSWLQSRTQRRSARRRNGVVWLQLQATDPDPPCPHPHPAVAPRLLRPGDPDTAARRGQHQVPQHRGHVCYLGVCRTHRLAEIIQWIRSASTKEPSGKASREPQNPYSYGRRRWREAEARLGSQDSGLQRGGQRSAQLAG